ncbi:MAG: hypothetical protein LBC18_10570 [Opitutaceae bacterium]|jgi:hypothetical protein|nr:hypothetical protein [Opitutaceae bacterium]
MNKHTITSPMISRLLLAGALLLPAGLLPAAPVNMIKQSDFEDRQLPPNGWDSRVAGQFNLKNEDPVFDTENPHSGKVSLRLRPGHLHYLAPVRKGSAVELRFWARGVSNSAPVRIQIRQFSPGDRRLFDVEQGLDDDWREYVFRTQLPADLVEEAKIYLAFWLHQDGVYWLDDISLTELPAVEGGEPSLVNPIRNPSFEAGTDGWTATVRIPEFAADGGWSKHDTGAAHPTQPGAKLLSMTGKKLPHGRRHLSLRVGENGRAVLTSAYFPARYGHKMQLEFWMRSDASHSFTAGITGGKNSDVRYQSQRQTSDYKWQKHTLPLTLNPSGGGLYSVQFQFNDPGIYHLDAVTLAEVRHAKETVLFPPSAAIQAPPGGPVANMFSRGDKPVFRLVVADEKPKTTPAYDLTVVDFLDRRVTGARIQAPTDADGAGGVEFAAPASRHGIFKIIARAAGAPADALPAAEQLYTVLPALPPPAERPDSFFGAHVDLTPYNLEIARRAGFRWLRLYPPMLTKWMALETAPGKWRFPTRELESGKALGFQFLGSFDTVPDWHADSDPTPGAIQNRWCFAYPPSDIGAWKDYVTRAFAAFSPCISAWELWNEPDGGYLQVKPGVKKGDVIMTLLDATREALDATGKPFVLIGPAFASPSPPLAWELLERGAGAKLDALSFHYYLFGAGGNNPDPVSMLSILEKYRAHKNHAGATLPLWQTEGGPYISGGRSWYDSWRIPPSSSMSPAQAAASMTRTALFHKAMGVIRYFAYSAPASETGHKAHDDGCSGFIEVTGLPSHGIAAHAAMVALTEDAAPRGFEKNAVAGGAVSVARFANAQTGDVDVYWSADAIPITEAAALREGDQVLDMMGNIIAPAKLEQTATGEFPLYVRRKPPSAMTP